MQQHPTAILLFSRSAEAEAEQKGFGAGAAGNRRIAAGLIRRTEATLARTGLPVFRSDETTQQGATFGQRLADAMDRVFAKGYDNLLIVGNDCPSILPRHLRAAAQLLESGQSVLGPDQRGGVWLIGLQRKDFAATAIAGLNWETATVFNELQALLPAVTQLSSRADFNTLRDFRRHWHQLFSRIGGLFDLVFGRVATINADGFLPQIAELRLSIGRGPPVARS